MGEFTTQSRIIGDGPRNSAVQGANFSSAAWNLPVFEYTALRPTQQTESYRTFSRFEEEDPLSAEAIEEFTDVAGNGFQGERPSRTSYDNGHDFYTTKTFLKTSHPDFKHKWLNSTGSGYNYFRGALLPRTSESVDSKAYGYFPTAPRMSQNDINLFGTAAIKSAAPTKPQASLSVLIGELLNEGLPSILGLDFLKNKNDRIRSVGGEYLNVEFGWKPLLSEVQAIAKSLLRASDQIAQFERDGRRHVRRGRTFPTQVDNLPLTHQSITGLSLAGFQFKDTAAFSTSRGGRAPGPVFLESITARDIYFRGCFQYSVVEGNTFTDKLDAYAQKANILLGTRVTPEVLWNLAPWSWLSDWAFNIGDVLANASYLSNDGLVMRYGYLMCNTRQTNRFSIPAGAKFTTGVETGPIYSLFGRDTKERVRATPYGFGLKTEDFSLRQWAILGALGLTRAPKTL